MTIENASYIGGLDSSMPPTGDALAEGDDHIRMIKAAIKATFPGRTVPDHSIIDKGGNYTVSASESGAVLRSVVTLTATLPLTSGVPDGTTFNIHNANGNTTIAAGVGDTINGLATMGLGMCCSAIISKRANIWVAMRTEIPSGTRVVFAQASAPFGWTQDVSDNANNRMLRVVSGGGAGVGGTDDPTVNDYVVSHSHYVSLSTGGMWSNSTHSHTVSDPGHAHGVDLGTGGGATLRAQANVGSDYSDMNTYAAYTGISIAAANIDHQHTASGNTNAAGAATGWRSRYNNVIICVKD